MSTHKSSWKKGEGRVAALFGARRQVLSGSSGRDDLTRSDSTHSRLFIETKYRARHAVRSLCDGTKPLARKENKTAVLALIDKGRPGCLLCVHSDDMAAVVAEYTMANPELVEDAIRRASPETDDRPAQPVLVP